mgnify:CR=1 FL=1
MKYGQLTLSSMTYTFRCDNTNCDNLLVCIMSKFENPPIYLSRCEVCKSGRLKRGDAGLEDLRDILAKQGIIHKLKKSSDN